MSTSLILFIGIVVGIGVIIIIVIRKFPTLASIDTEDLPEEQQSQLKKDIMADRLSRKIKERLGFIQDAMVPIGRVIKRAGIDFYNNARSLEKRYRLKRTEHPKSPIPTSVVEGEILAEAESYFKKGEMDKAEDAYISLIRHDERNIAAYEGLSEVYFEKKEYEYAKATHNYILQFKDKAIKKSPSKKNNKGKRAVTEDEREIALHHFELGEIYEKNNEQNKALRSYKEAVKLDKRNPKYLDRLTEVSILQGNKLLSQKTLDTLKEVNTDNTKIRDWQRRIDAL